MAQIADTGFLVAYWNRADINHRWARSLALRTPLLTCAPVLTEAAYLLGTSELLLQMLVDGDLVVDFDLHVHATALLTWMKKYSDVDPGLADACIVRMASVTRRAEIITTDRRDFSIYRTLEGRVLKCIFP